ncbi:type II toxin-antitoxin system HicA family toxin [Streptosporangium sp. NPDC004379]|uniref:type II toxin-antitoxin system HicA family toxin n=1 Tax=Streptosporangium sp. NPDC004379 TaxID=3366189 RepID=UPI00369801A3
MIRHLERNGFHRVPSRRHAKLRNDQGRSVAVPRHRQLRKGTYHSILRQAGLKPSSDGG